mgnify:FL=1
MDLDPFEPVGIQARTMRFLDVFLLHCLLSESPPDTAQEIAALGRNQQVVAQRGREPGLRLERGERSVALADWAAELLADMLPIAQRLDQVQGDTLNAQAVAQASQALALPDGLPSARVLQTVQQEYAGAYVGFVKAQSARIRQSMLDMPIDAGVQADFAAMAARSWSQQRAMEASDTGAFDEYLRAYLSPDRLRV